MNSRIPRIIFFGLLTLVAFSELLFSNIGTLTGNMTSVATMLGLTLEQERIRLLILIALDAIAGIGAVIAVIGLLRRNGLLAVGARICAIGFVAYGLYQLFAALTQLGAAVRGPVMGAGGTYLLVGIVAWFVGRRAA